MILETNIYICSHTCPDDRRGSWPENEDDNGEATMDEQTTENVAFVESLFSSVGHVPLPNLRAALFGAHATLSEALRMSYWKSELTSLVDNYY